LIEFNSSLSWQRSRHCDAGQCVEAALIDGDVVVRDSKDPDGPILQFTASEWTAFLAGVRDGDFQFGNTGL
jgi:Domain of unknown function (DUF397)